MDSKTFSGLLRSKTVLKSVLAALILIVLTQLLTSFWVMHQLRRRLDLQVSGTFWPIPFLPAFYSSDARFEWKNRITLLSGNVKIHYNVLPSVRNNSIRVKIYGRGIQAALSGGWRKMQGMENIKVDVFEADVEIARKGLGEIYFVRAESPSFQFHIQETRS